MLGRSLGGAQRTRSGAEADAGGPRPARLAPLESQSGAAAAAALDDDARRCAASGPGAPGGRRGRRGGDADMIRWLALFVLMLTLPALAQRPITYEKDTLVVETASGARHSFNIELAVTPDQMAQGLMYRRQMAADAGMLFIYPAPQPTAFWMKNTLIPLDMLFIAADGHILNIAERTIPLTETPIPSAGPIKAVLELNGGTSARLGIKPGDRVRYKSVS